MPDLGAALQVFWDQLHTDGCKIEHEIHDFAQRITRVRDKPFTHPDLQFLATFRPLVEPLNIVFSCFQNTFAAKSEHPRN
ncbi:hypothetical protein MB46_06985 [Arthrobacter alpinus]|nr:hypothetical protein MB46_06985 [Arthrobacter alpinus]